MRNTSCHKHLQKRCKQVLSFAMVLSDRLSLLPDIQRYARALALAFVVFYFAFHSISGERGLVAWFKESRRLESLEAELAALSQQRLALESKVQLLAPSSIDPDMLDESARKVLGLARPDEVVILTP